MCEKAQKRTRIDYNNLTGLRNAVLTLHSAQKLAEEDLRSSRPGHRSEVRTPIVSVLRRTYHSLDGQVVSG